MRVLDVLGKLTAFIVICGLLVWRPPLGIPESEPAGEAPRRPPASPPRGRTKPPANEPVVLLAILRDYSRHTYYYERQFELPGGRFPAPLVDLGGGLFFRARAENRYWSVTRKCYGYVSDFGETFNRQCSSSEVLQFDAAWRQAGFRLVRSQ